MRKTSRALAVTGALLFVVGTASLLSQQKGGGAEISGPYDVVPNWPVNMCGDGFQPGSASGVFAETPDRIFIFQRGCLPVQPDGSFGGDQDLVPTRNASGYDLSQKDPARHPRWDHVLVIVNRDGQMVESWEQHNKLFVRPHKVLINPYDPEKHIWIVDDGAESFYKFTNDGKLVQSWGEFRVRGNDENHFGRPTDIAWLPDGTFFLSDGYVNTRVVKFDKDGKFLMTWGTPGTGPSQFNLVHSIAVDAQRRVYVSDRSNSRIQVFDENGKFLDMWENIKRPYYINLTQDQHLWVADGITNKFMKFDLMGKLLESWGTFGAFPGGFWGVHQFSVDTEGNLYTADVHVGRVQKFRPRPGGDPAQLVGMQYRATTN
jgi:peptidylamidoglycolate lyase